MIYILSGWSAPVLLKGLRWAARILLVCALLLGVAAGVNWLSNQSWDSGSGNGMTWTCDKGQTMTYRYMNHHQDVLLMCR